MIIQKSAVSDYLDRQLDDWRWLKKLSRREITQAIRELRPRPVFQTELWVHQLVCFYLGMCQPRFAFLLDMGTGKTLITLMLMHQRLRTKEIERSLVCVPRVLNAETWVTAAGEHSDLEPWDCTVESIEEKWDRLMTPRGDFSVIDYQGLALATTKKRAKKKGKGFELVRDDKKVAMLRKLYQLAALDECHNLRNHSNLWHSIVYQVTRDMPFCYGLTGTLFGHDLEEAWAQLYIIDQGETFGPNLGMLRAAFYDSKPGAFKVVHTFRKDMTRKAAAMLRHRSIRYDESEVQELPARVVKQVLFDLSPAQHVQYINALQGLINAGGKLMEMDAQWIRMRQIASGFVSWEDDTGRHQVVFPVNPKLDHLLAIIDEAQPSKVVVAYTYTESAQLVADRLRKEGVGFAWIYGGTKDKVAEKKRFQTDPGCRVLLLNSEAGGTGVDGLQGVSWCLVFYECPCSPIVRQQTLKRVHRPGSTRRVFIWDLTAKRTVEVKVLENALAGRDAYETLMGGGLRDVIQWAKSELASK